MQCVLNPWKTCLFIYLRFSPTERYDSAAQPDITTISWPTVKPYCKLSLSLNFHYTSTFTFINSICRLLFKLPRIVPDQREKFDCEDIFKKHSREAEVRMMKEIRKKIFPFHEEVGGIGRREYLFRFLDLD